MNFFGFSSYCIVMIVTLMMLSFADAMEIQVRYGSKEFPVEMNENDTVETLKAKIENIHEIGNISTQKQILTRKITGKFWVDLTEDQKTIDKYGIEEYQDVWVSWDEFRFFVEYKEKKYSIKMKAINTIKEVKEKMKEITGIPTKKQTLSHYRYGKFLDIARLIENGIVKDMTILLFNGSGITVEWEKNLRETEFFVILVNGTDTVATVKQKISAINKQRHKSELEGVIKLSKCAFRCRYANALADGKTMDEYGIGEGITIYMEVVTKDESSPPSSSAVVADNSEFHIHVVHDYNNTRIWVEGTDTMECLKDKIWRIMKPKFGCELGDVFLVKRPFRVDIDKLGDNKKTMYEYGIKEADTIVANTSVFLIYVKYGSERINVSVKRTDTVKDLKEKIAKSDKLGNIPIQKQILTRKITWNFWIDLTDDQKTIDKYGIEEEQNVCVSWDEFEFFVEYKEKMHPIKVKSMTTIKEIKEKMAEITGIPAEKQTISHYKYGEMYDYLRLLEYEKKDITFLIMSDGSGITVKWQNRDFFIIYVKGTDIVATVKQKIMAINKKRQKIRAIYEQRRHKVNLNSVIKLSKCDCENAKALSDGKTMDEYGIEEGMTIYMKVGTKDDNSPPSSSATVADGSDFHIHMEFSGKQTIVWVKGTDTVQSLKDMFGCGSIIKHPSRAGNKLADNGKTMDEYGIKEGDTIESLGAKELD